MSPVECSRAFKKLARLAAASDLSNPTDPIDQIVPSASSTRPEREKVSGAEKREALNGS
jgi:hypothetical protein